MKNYSLWNDIKVNNSKKINQDLDVDVLIIGGGITGLSTLYQLRNSNFKTILVERNQCGKGVTSRSTAKITYLQEKQYMNIRKYLDVDTAKKYLQSQRDAVLLLVQIIKDENIDCNLALSPSYLFTNQEKNIETLNEEYQFLKDCKIKVQKVKQIPILGDVVDALKVEDTYVFHPLKYINHLKEILNSSIYEHSKVSSIHKENGYYICNVNEYHVKAKYVVIATHYPYFLFPFMMPVKNYVETSYIGAKKENNLPDFNAINIDNDTISLRIHHDDKNDYLVYLYQSFKSCDIKSIKENFDSLREKNNFDYVWSNKDIITNDYLPFIGRVYENNDSFLIATGYNTWGMTNGTLAGKILADIILKKDNPYISLFYPNRSINFSKFVRFPIDISASVKAIIKSTKNNVNNKNVIHKKIDGKSVLIYKDENGVEHIVLNRCPHMKCGLQFNEVEKTWDCYCHGSRFDLDGNCIEGPSNFDITFKQN